MRMRRVFSSKRMLSMMAASVLLAAANAAWAADSGQMVECLLPGQIHTVGGHPTMGPRRPVQTTPEDCRQRGGEYTVPQAPASTAAAMLAADADDWVRCLLPKQLRQLGEKKRYYTNSRVVHSTRASCQARHGSVLSVLRSKPPH